MTSGGQREDEKKCEVALQINEKIILAVEKVGSFVFFRGGHMARNS